MAKKKRKKKRRKKTIAQLKAEIAAVKQRNEMLIDMALGIYKASSMTKRNRKRRKDARNHWSKDQECEFS
jgi:hypothetical protein